MQFESRRDEKKIISLINKEYGVSVIAQSFKVDETTFKKLHVRDVLPIATLACNHEKFNLERSLSK